MFSQFLYYLLGILAVIGGVLVLERLVAGPHTTSGTGYASVDSAFDFDRLRRKHYGARATNLLGHHGRSALPVLQERLVMFYVFSVLFRPLRIQESCTIQQMLTAAATHC